MNLRNNQITVGEILANPQARTLLSLEFPMVRGSPMRARARNMPLQNVLFYARRYVPQQKINQVLAQLQAV